MLHQLASKLPIEYSGPDLIYTFYSSMDTPLNKLPLFFTDFHAVWFIQWVEPFKFFYFLFWKVYITSTILVIAAIHLQKLDDLVVSLLINMREPLVWSYPVLPVWQDGDFLSSQSFHCSIFLALDKFVSCKNIAAKKTCPHLLYSYCFMTLPFFLTSLT